MAEHFCSCKHTTCKVHPSNHDLGCDPCMSKNLKVGKIPSCIFNKVNEDLSDVCDYSIEGFVNFFLANKKS